MSRRSTTRRTLRAVALTTAVVCGCVGSTVHGNGLEPSTDPAVEPVEDAAPPAVEEPIEPVGDTAPPAVEEPVVAVGLPPVPPASQGPVVAVGLPPVPPAVEEGPVVAVGLPPVPPAVEEGPERPVRVAVGMPPVPPNPHAMSAAVTPVSHASVDVDRVTAVLLDAAALVRAARALVDARF